MKETQTWPLFAQRKFFILLPAKQSNTQIFFYAWKQASCLMRPFNLHSHVQPGNVEMLLSSRQIQYNGKWRCIHNLKGFQFVFLQEEKNNFNERKKKKSGWFGKCVKFPNFAGEQNCFPGHSCGNQLAGKGIQDRWQRWIMYSYRTRLYSFIWKTD